MIAQSVVDVLDESLLLFDQALSGRESVARARLTEVLAERARGGEDRQALLDDILKIVLDPDVTDDQVGARLRGDIGHERMRAAWEARRERLPRDHGHLAMMDASMAYLRQFVPDVLAAVRFAGGPGMDDLLQAVAILAGLYATKARKVPDGAPDGFVPARWAGYLENARKAGDVTAFRHYWELCVLMALRDGLRSGDVYVPGSRRYADPSSFLLSPQQWEPQRLEFCHVVGKPASAADALARASDELHAALSDLEAQLARGGGPGEVRLERGRGTGHPAADRRGRPGRGRGAARPARRAAARVPIAAVLVEIDARTGFTVVTDHPPSAGHQPLAQLVGPAQHRRPDQQHSRAAGAALHLHAARRSINHEHALIPRHEALLPGTPRTDVLKARPSGPPKLIGGRAVLRGPMPARCSRV